MENPTHKLSLAGMLFALIFTVKSCEQKKKEQSKTIENDIKISGAVSMEDEGNQTAIGNLGQQMKNCYADLDKILKHYGCTFDDVIVESIFTTNMALFLENVAYRNEVYTKQFPTGF